MYYKLLAMLEWKSVVDGDQLIWIYIDFKTIFVCLFVLVLYIPVFVMSGCFPTFLDGISTMQRIKCLAQGHYTVPLVSLKPANHKSQVYITLSTKPPCSSQNKIYEGSAL